MPRSLIFTFVGTLAVWLGSSQALAIPRTGESDFRCTASNGLSIHVPDGSMRFMQSVVLHGTPEALGDLIDKRSSKTTEETLDMSFPFSATCASTDGDPISCKGTALAAATYTFFDETADESLTVRKQLHVRESKFEITKDSNGIFQLNFRIVTHPLAGRERILEIKQALGPVTNSPNPWNPGCESIPTAQAF